MLEARNLSVGPPGAGEPAIRDCSLRLGAGEWLGVTGPNGSGKSCLALALAGLSPARAGEVRLDGEPLNPTNRDATAGAIAVVMQEPASQLLATTVHDELCFTARNLGRPEVETLAAVARWSERLGLEAWRHEDPRSLSAGWQQMVLVAAALVARPRILIVDEGGAHLDARLRDLMLEALRKQVNGGLAVVWVSQEPTELLAADRILTLGSGGSAKPGIAVRDEVEAVIGPPLLRMDVAPWAGGGGPHVRTSVPMQIDIPRSGLVALVGPNGCGKSVVLEAAAGLVECAQIRLSRSSTLDPPPILAGQYPEQQICCETVEDEVTFAALGRGATREWAVEQGRRYLGAMGLNEHFLRRRTWNLSSGEKRIVEVVAALSTPAQLVLLDEPTCGLDGMRKFGLTKLVRERAREVAMIVASQDHAWLGDVSARIVDFDPGRLEFDAKSQQKNGLTQTCPSA